MVEPLGGMPVGPYGPGPTEQGTVGEFGPKEPSVPGESFVDLLESSINEVNHMKARAGDKMQKLVTGEISSVHEVMISVEEAGIAFNLLLQIRNKLMQAWDQLRRTPV